MTGSTACDYRCILTWSSVYLALVCSARARLRAALVFSSSASGTRWMLSGTCTCTQSHPQPVTRLASLGDDGDPIHDLSQAWCCASHTPTHACSREWGRGGARQHTCTYLLGKGGQLNAFRLWYFWWPRLCEVWHPEGHRGAGGSLGGAVLTGPCGVQHSRQSGGGRTSTRSPTARHANLPAACRRQPRSHCIPCSIQASQQCGLQGESRGWWRPQIAISNYTPPPRLTPTP